MFAPNPEGGNLRFLLRTRNRWTTRWFLIGPLLWAAVRDVSGADFPSLAGPGLTYTNYRMAEVPWSIHVIRVERTNLQFEVHSAHSGGTGLGLSTLGDQVQSVNSRLGTPVAAVNGDFYQRDGPYAGDPRGLQIVDGELVSAPGGGAVFWIDALGQPHATNVVSLFQMSWPNGKTRAFGLNEDRPPDRAELYTSAAGSSTHTTGGRELVLEREINSPWLPLRIGRVYKARVREIRESGSTQLAPGIMVLSIGPALIPDVPMVATGAVLTLSTGSSPSLRGAKTAIGGGPVLLRAGKRLKITGSDTESYEFSTMTERHPRTAVGWNRNYLFLIEVDGRQKNLSVGMTLDELSAYLMKLGCQEAMNLDGGGSATLWYNGKVRNSPCDGQERAIANSLIVVRKNSKLPTPTAPPVSQ
jgi:Phosphodiester glycosidase